MFSTSLSDGDDALAAQYNNLRLDIFDYTSGHDHDGTSSGGKKVDHADLVDGGAIPNTYLTHAKLTKHVQGTGTSSDPDADGGGSGVHGLASGVQVAGALGSQLVIQAGKDSSGGTSGSVTFPTAFSNVPVVVATPATPTSTYGEWDVRINTITTTGFVWYASNSVVAVHWAAFGTRT